MTDINDFDKEFVSRIRESTAEFIRVLRTEYKGNLPKRRIYVPEGRSVVEKDVARPRLVLQNSKNIGAKIFRDTAEWIEANPDRSYRWEDTHLEQEHLIEDFAHDLIELCYDIVEATGGLVWEEEAFERAAERFLIDMSYMGPLGPISTEFKTIFPLTGFTFSGEKIELASDIRILDRQDGEWIAQIEISELTPKEVATIYTCERSRSIGEGRAPGEISHGIKINMNGSPYAANDEQVRTAVITGLRLFKSLAASVHGNRGYRMAEGPLAYREGILDVYATIGPMSTPVPPYSRRTYNMRSEEKEWFGEFWSRYKDEFNAESESNIARSLRRFNETHQKQNVEDRIVDCAIALEGTLLQDVNPGSSITFRLMLRSGLLLDNKTPYNRETIREVFRAIYIARGEIVHSNRQLDEIIEENKRFEIFDTGKPTPREFASITRHLLGRTLLRYIVEKVDIGRSVAEVNQEMDAAALNADYQ